jgi:hypothetical protein
MMSDFIMIPDAHTKDESALLGGRRFLFDGLIAIITS